MLTLSHIAAWFRPADPSAGLASDERTPAADAATRAAETPPPPPSRAWLLWLRNPQTWRLASGLVLFAFVLTHFLNHALGHVSLEVMQQGQAIRRAVWGSWPGTLLHLWSRGRARRPGTLEAHPPPHMADADLGGRSDRARALDPVPRGRARHDHPRAQRLLRRGAHLCA